MIFLSLLVANAGGLPLFVCGYGLSLALAAALWCGFLNFAAWVLHG